MRNELRETDTISGRQGKRAEDLFRKTLFWKLGIQPTTPKQGEDIFSHFDLCVDGHTYDVKSRKSISRDKPLQDNLPVDRISKCKR